jgi:hypothetical protein
MTIYPNREKEVLNTMLIESKFNTILESILKDSNITTTNKHHFLASAKKYCENNNWDCKVDNTLVPEGFNDNVSGKYTNYDDELLYKYISPYFNSITNGGKRRRSHKKRKGTKRKRTKRSRKGTKRRRH